MATASGTGQNPSPGLAHGNGDTLALGHDLNRAMARAVFRLDGNLTGD